MNSLLCKEKLEQNSFYSKPLYNLFRLKPGIEKIVYHPNFDWETYNYDLALLKLEAPVNFNAYPHIRPVKLFSLDSTL